MKNLEEKSNIDQLILDFQQKFNIPHYKDPLEKFKRAVGIDVTNNMFWEQKGLGKGKTFHKKSTQSGSIPDIIFLKSLTQKKNIAFRRYEHTKVYVIDIDLRSQYNELNLSYITQKVTEELGEGFFYEKSVKTNGVHIWYRFDDYINSYQWMNFIAFMQSKYGIVIEVKASGTDTIKLPFSKEYTDFGYWNSKRKCINTVSYEKGMDLILNAKSIIVPKELSKFKAIPVRAIYKDIEGSSPEKLENSLNSCRYGRGTRFNTQIKIGFLCKHLNYDYDQFEKECYRLHDGSSYDMTISSGYQITLMLKSIWEFVEANFDDSHSSEKEGNNKFFDVLAHVTDEELISDHDYAQLKQFIRIFYDGTRFGSQGSRKDKFLSDVEDVMHYLIGANIYRQERKASYDLQKLKPLEKGIPFGQKLMNLISKKYQIKNIKRVVKFLEMIGFITLLKDQEGFSYSYKGYGYTKHYKIISINTIIILIKKFMSSKKSESYYINNVDKFTKTMIESLADLGGIHLVDRLEMIRGSG